MSTILILRKTFSTWALIAPKGHVLYELSPRSISRDQAYAEATAWASSWGGMTVRFEDEQDTKTD